LPFFLPEGEVAEERIILGEEIRTGPPKLSTRFVTPQGSIVTHQGSIPTPRGSIPTHQGSIVTPHGSIPTHPGSIVTHHGSIVTHHGSIVTHPGSIPTHQGSIPTRQGSSDPCIDPADMGFLVGGSDHGLAGASCQRAGRGQGDD
jgi:hypothetical protein